MTHEDKLRQRAAKLIATGKMPTLQELAFAILEARKVYANQIRRARREAKEVK